MTLGFGGWGVWEYSNKEAAHALRSDRTNRFNNRVDEWETTALPNWKKLSNKNLAIAGMNSSNVVYNLKADYSDVVSKASDIHEYTPMKYIYSGSFTHSTSWKANLLLSNYSIVPSNIIVGLPSSLLMTKIQTSASSTWKLCYHTKRGAFDQTTGTCTVYQRLMAVCFVLHPDGDTWKYSHGCYKDGTEYQKYEPTPVRSKFLGPLHVDFPHIYVTFRHISDPYLFREEFGRSHGDIHATLYLLTTVVGILFILLAVVIYKAMIKYKQTREKVVSHPLSSIGTSTL